MTLQKDSQESEKAVVLMVMVYNSERYRLKSAKAKDRDADQERPGLSFQGPLPGQSLGDVLNSPSNDVWQHTWSVVNQESHPRPQCPRFLLMVTHTGVWCPPDGPELRNSTLHQSETVSDRHVICSNCYSMAQGLRPTKTLSSGWVFQRVRGSLPEVSQGTIPNTGLSGMCAGFKQTGPAALHFPCHIHHITDVKEQSCDKVLLPPFYRWGVNRWNSSLRSFPCCLPLDPVLLPRSTYAIVWTMLSFPITWKGSESMSHVYFPLLFTPRLKTMPGL